MAYALWLQPNKTSGSGNDSVSISALSDNTGRNLRSTQVTFKASNVSDVIRTVNQAGKPEFVEIQQTASVNKEGGNITISGKSNCAKLTFEIGSNNAINISLPETYTANSASTNNGEEIVGDPGASAEYDFSITISNIGENETAFEKVSQLIVKCDSGHESTCTITQAASEPELEVTPETLEFPWNAETEELTVSFTVNSNTNWIIE